MANFSFGKFFGKSPRQPRFKPVSAEGARESSESVEPLPVGRLVSFTDHGPEDAPLFQELEPSSVSPFSVVGGSRPSLGSGGLPGPARTVVEEGFTADELAAMVPPHCVRKGAVPATQVIPLPHAVLRASLGAGQPAVLLSQLHQACPDLFLAPSSLDQDLVIALPPQKVQRLVARTETAVGSVLPLPPATTAPVRPVLTDTAMEPLGWSLAGTSQAAEEAAAQAFAVPPSKVKLPPPRRKFDEMQGTDLRPLIETPASPLLGGPFKELGGVGTGVHPDTATALSASPFQKAEGSALAAAASPFQVTSSLPNGQPARGGLPKRFESPFAVVSPGEVPAVLESPFARHPMTGLDEPPVQPPAAPISDSTPDPMPDPPSTVSLRLSALLQGQNAGTLGFAPERVPANVRVSLATNPLLSQVASGRIRVSVEEVVAGLEAKFQPAFKGAQPGLELHVPLRELFDALPEATPPTPIAAPVASTFETPFSIRAEEDTPLTAINSPFQLAPVSPPAAPPPLPSAPPVWNATPLPVASAPTVQPPPTFLLPLDTSAPAPEPARARNEEPFMVIPEPLAEAVPAPHQEAEPPIQNSPFLIVPEEPQGRPAQAAVAASLPPPLFTPPPAASEAPREMAPLAPPPVRIPVPPLHNPFALAPGDGIRAGLGLELPLMSFDDEPVPLESLREDESSYLPPPAPPVVLAVPAPVAPPECPAIVTSCLLETPAVPAPPPAPILPPAEAPTPVVRRALSEQVPLPPPVLPPVFSPLADSHLVSAEETSTPLKVEPTSLAPTDPVPPSPAATPVETPAAIAPTSPFLDADRFALPPLPTELLNPAPPAGVPAPAAEASTAPEVLPGARPASDTPLITPALADAPPFNVPSPPPTADDRAAFAFVFAPSALAHSLDGASPPLGEMDSLPAIALAKLPPLGDESPTPPAIAPVASAPGFSFAGIVPSTAAAPIDSTAAQAPAASMAPMASEPPAPMETILPTLPNPAQTSPTLPPAYESTTIEDLSFGYVDNPAQLALRAVFATDRTLATQDVVDLAARLDGLCACLVHTPHASLHSAASPVDSDDVRHFRERAGALFEKTASLVRELDPSAREQNFTLRTGKGVVSFFAIDDICLAVLHAEPSFRPGVREKLTLVARTVADMLAA